MSGKKLTVLVIVAVIMVVWAVVQWRVSNKPKAEPSGLLYLIQGLDPAHIDSIVLGTGEGVVTLKRLGGRFVVVDKDNYPAKTSAINDLITKCMEVQTSQFVTDNPANHEDLEVTEQKARSIVKFFKQDSSLITGLVAGKTKELGQGTYVRLASSDKVYITPSVPRFGSSAINFIEQELITLKQEDITSVTVNSPNGKYTLKKEEGTEGIVLEDIPAGKKFKSSDGQSVFTALTSLRCDDVKAKSPDSTFDKQYVCRLTDSTEYTVNIATKDDETYITCSAVFTEGRPTTIRKDESEEELKVKEAKLLADDKAKEFTAKHHGWVYQIPDWKAKNLTMELEDLTEDEEKPQEKTTVEDPNTVKPDVSTVIKAAEPNDIKEAEEPNQTNAGDPNTVKSNP